MAATSYGWIGNHQHPWNQLPCLPYDERSRLGFSVPQGYLSNNSRVETVLQGLLSLGPHVFLVCIAPVRVFQLYNAKLVTIPNYRGLIKAVSELGREWQNDEFSKLRLAVLWCLIRLTAGLHCLFDKQNSSSHITGSSIALPTRKCRSVRAVSP